MFTQYQYLVIVIVIGTICSSSILLLTSFYKTENSSRLKLMTLTQFNGGWLGPAEWSSVVIIEIVASHWQHSICFVKLGCFEIIYWKRLHICATINEVAVSADLLYKSILVHHCLKIPGFAKISCKEHCNNVFLCEATISRYGYHSRLHTRQAEMLPMLILPTLFSKCYVQLQKCHSTLSCDILPYCLFYSIIVLLQCLYLLQVQLTMAIFDLDFLLTYDGGSMHCIHNLDVRTKLHRTAHFANSIPIFHKLHSQQEIMLEIQII